MQSNWRILKFKHRWNDNDRNSKLPNKLEIGTWKVSKNWGKKITSLHLTTSYSSLPKRYIVTPSPSDTSCPERPAAWSQIFPCILSSRVPAGRASQAAFPRLGRSWGTGALGHELGVCCEGRGTGAMENCETPRAAAAVAAPSPCGAQRSRAEPCGAGRAAGPSGQPQPGQAGQIDGAVRDWGTGQCGAGGGTGRDGIGWNKTGWDGTRRGCAGWGMGRCGQRGAAAPRSGPAPPGATPPKLWAGKARPGESECGPRSHGSDARAREKPPRPVRDWLLWPGPGRSRRGPWGGGCCGWGEPRGARLAHTPRCSDRAAETHAAFSLLRLSKNKQTSKQAAQNSFPFACFTRFIASSHWLVPALSVNTV